MARKTTKFPTSDKRIKGFNMHYTGQVYRPPSEYDTPLLEVTIGCSHNKCNFCMMYKNTPFKISPMEHIKEDIEELQSCGVSFRKIYLLNGDPWCLPTQKLLEIAKLIHTHLPSVKSISSYVSIKNIMGKSQEEINELRAAFYNDLHIGVETAYAPALDFLNKGCNCEDIYEQIHKLNRAKFRYNVLLMLGIAGKGNAEKNAEANAKFLNETKPRIISVMPTTLAFGSELEKLTDAGAFIEQTQLDMILEEKMLINSINYNGYFYGGHNMNLVPVNGFLKDKQKLMTKLEHAINTLDQEILNSTRPRESVSQDLAL